MPIRSIFLVLLAACHLLPASVHAADGSGWDALRQPGAVALMRHALAPGTGDPDDFTLGDCSTQRTLNDAGRDQARAIGAALADNDIRFDRVLTSQWCRCRETAELLKAGPVEPYPAINSFFAGRGDAAAQTAAVREMLMGRDRTEALLLVTHQVNITALTDIFPSSGEIIVIHMSTDGRITVTERLLIEP